MGITASHRLNHRSREHCEWYNGVYSASDKWAGGKRKLTIELRWASECCLRSILSTLQYIHCWHNLLDPIAKLKNVIVILVAAINTTHQTQTSPPTHFLQPYSLFRQARTSPGDATMQGEPSRMPRTAPNFQVPGHC